MLEAFTPKNLLVFPSLEKMLFLLFSHTLRVSVCVRVYVCEGKTVCRSSPEETFAGSEEEEEGEREGDVTG